jgi:2,4-dienoyl-CoA reductase-like NADH-dependent reductase (Old Yellow Enzyme family)
MTTDASEKAGLFQPVNVGLFELSNRMVMSLMTRVARLPCRMVL